MTVVYVLLIIAVVLIVLYLLAIMPRMTHRAAREPLKGIHYAHRGLHDNEADAPENSMAAFKKAMWAGFGMEMDVQLSKDKVPVIFHDYTLKRICGKEGKVCDYTWEELKTFRLCSSQETIPALKDVLQAIGGKVPLIIELKAEQTDISICPIVDDMLRNYQGQYCIESFHPMVLVWYRRYHNDVVRGQLSSGFLKSGERSGSLYFCLQNLLMNWITKPDFVAYDITFENSLSRRICHRLYKNMAVAWTVKSQEELERMKGKYDIFIFDSFVPKDGKNRIKANKNRKK